MCKFTNNTKHSRIDRCMRKFIKNLQGVLHPSFEIVACCCGHNKYSMTILIKAKSSEKIVDIVNGVYIPRKRNLYKKDKEGYYYIPEVKQSEGISHPKAMGIRNARDI